jgi:hypothetical protein
MRVSCRAAESDLLSFSVGQALNPQFLGDYRGRFWFVGFAFAGLIDVQDPGFDRVVAF